MMKVCDRSTTTRSRMPSICVLSTVTLPSLSAPSTRREQRIRAAASGDDADLERWWRQSARYAVIAGADLLTGRARSQSIDDEIAQTVCELAPVVRRREHDDASDGFRRQNAGGHSSAQNDSAHGMRDDVDRRRGR